MGPFLPGCRFYFRPARYDLSESSVSPSFQAPRVLAWRTAASMSPFEALRLMSKFWPGWMRSASLILALFAL